MPESSKAIPIIDTFVISPDGKSITCLRCKRTSYHPKDVEQHYCGNCQMCHDDIFPPARQWWIDHPVPSLEDVLRRIINDVVAAVVKRDEVPASSHTHECAAIVGLLALCPDWQPWDEASREVVEEAKQLMAYYPSQNPNPQKIP